MVNGCNSAIISILCVVYVRVRFPLLVPSFLIYIFSLFVSFFVALSLSLFLKSMCLFHSFVHSIVYVCVRSPLWHYAFALHTYLYSAYNINSMFYLDCCCCCCSCILSFAFICKCWYAQSMTLPAAADGTAITAASIVSLRSDFFLLPSNLSLNYHDIVCEQTRRRKNRERISVTAATRTKNGNE